MLACAQPPTREAGDGSADAPAAELRLALRNELAACETARLALTDFLAGSHPSAQAVFRIELALEEIMMNQIMHAYPGRPPGAGEIGLCACHRGDGVLELLFTDRGVAFDPLQRPDPVLPRNLDEARPGGLGLFLTRKNARALRWERVDGQNRLTMVMDLQ